MVKAFKAAHEAALALYRAPQETYTYPRGSRCIFGPLALERIITCLCRCS